MALDTQPLSAGRRSLMLLVMLALLGASLGFAQWLVVLRQAIPRYHVSIISPAGFMEPVPAYDAMEGAVVSGQGKIKIAGLADQPRRFVGFSYDMNIVPDQRSIGGQAEDLLSRFTSNLLEEKTAPPAKPAILGGHGAMHLEREFGREKQAMFIMLRLTAVPGHVVAICYSGPGVITDADREIFESFCSTGVIIKQDTGPR